MHKKNIHETKVLVTDASRGCSVAVIRSLGRAGYSVFAADSDPESIGFRSRYVSHKMVYPSPESDPQQFIEFLLKMVTVHKIDLIIPVTELVIHPILSARESFENVTKVALPRNELFEFVTDKTKTLQLAQKLGVPVPKTYIANNSEDALRCINNLSWPIVLKPISSALLGNDNRVEKFGVTYAASRDELNRSMQKFEGKCAVLLQHYHQGVGYGIEILMHNGKPLAAFSHKRLREFPITGGPSSYRESVKPDQILYEYAVRLLSEIGWTGLAMVEFKVDGSDAVLMEINGRVWGSLPLAVISGVDFPLLLAKLFLGEPSSIRPQLDWAYKIGLRCRDLQRDLMWITCVLMQKQKYPFLKFPSRMQALRAIAGLFNPVHKFDLFCLNDPMPAFAELPRIIKKYKEKTRAT